MKKYLISVLSLFLWLSFLQAQKSASLPEFQLKKSELEQHMYYIASDELMGRRTGSDGAEMAAQYIAQHFERYGLKPAVGDSSYFQLIPFDRTFPPDQATVTLDSIAYTQSDNMIVLSGGPAYFTSEVVYAGYGWQDDETGQDDYKNLDVKGKIVMVLSGKPGIVNPYQSFKLMGRKAELAREQGAIGVIELFRMNFPWSFFKNYFIRERMEVAKSEENGSNGFLYALVKEEDPMPVKDLEAIGIWNAKVDNSGSRSERIYASNVIGVVEGTDENLKDEYILLSAHYDHVGVGKQGGGPYSPQDSIFNGARDNGMGTVALLAAAKSLAKSPPKRSVAFVAFTGEEMGLIGSVYYVGHPVIPLENTVFNLNNDGGGYNTTEAITIIGYDKTNTTPELVQAARNFSLSVNKDPAPEQNLYARSDNISFARKGIPAVDFAPGITAMNEEIFKFYHQVTDNPDTIDYDYLLSFCRAFSFAARLIANKAETPAWMPGKEINNEN